MVNCEFLRKTASYENLPLNTDPKKVVNEINALFIEAAPKLVTKHCGTGTVPEFDFNESILIHSVSERQIVEIKDSLKN